MTGAADGYARMADKPACDAAASRAGPRERAHQPAQRPARLLADRQHRRRARDLSPGPRRAAHLRHRGGRADRSRTGCASATEAGGVGAGRRRGDRRRAQAARPDRDADPARRRRLERGAGRGRPRRLPSPPRSRSSRTAVRRGRRGAALAASRRAILMTGRALRAKNLEVAGRIAAATGCRLLAQTSNAPHRARRRAGRGRAHPLSDRRGAQDAWRGSRI